MEIADLSVRRFAADKLQKLNLFETPRCFADVYCLEAGQEQAPHAHEGADKLYVVLEGRALVRVGEEERELRPQQAALAPSGQAHGVRNPGPERLTLLVFMARDAGPAS
ncbi:MAG TPA: cupin domain-containing protein [Chloroflexota bacterium]|jgi:mannose-6-phosphate isomerase-like protein (cupin superfamily)|nr:cupin domain-containing protein [Chloroflexota bacterium]